MAGSLDFLDRIAGPLERHVQARATSHPRLWAALVVAAATALALASRFPAYRGAARFPGSFADFATTAYGRAIAWWLEHPFRSVPAETFFPPAALSDPLVAGSVSHLDKLAFRPFLPLVNQVVDGGVWTLFVASHLAVLVTFLLVYRLCLRLSGDAVLATAATLGWSASWAGSWGFNDLVCGDAVAVALLLGAFAAPPGSWRIVPLLLAAGLTDERAAIAAPLVGLLHGWQVRSPFDPAPPASARPGTLRLAAPVIAGLAACILVRLAATAVYGTRAGTSMMATVDIFLYHVLVSYPRKFFAVFEFFWVFPLLLLANLAVAGPAARRAALGFAGFFGLAAAPAFLVWDLERSLCYLLPGVIAAAVLLPGDPRIPRRLALAAAVAGILWVEPNASFLRLYLF